MPFVPLREKELCDAMRGYFIGREIHVVQTTASTSDAVFERISPETPAGLTVFAETQTAGRGQRGRVWESATGKGLWFSVLLRPPVVFTDSVQLIFWAGISAAETLIDAGVAARFHAPNDIMAESKKIGGVLVEMRAQAKASHVAIVGIGINVNQMPEDFPDSIRDKAVSAAIVLGRPLDRTDFAISLLHRLNASYPW